MRLAPVCSTLELKRAIEAAQKLGIVGRQGRVTNWKRRLLRDWARGLRDWNGVYFERT